MAAQFSAQLGLRCERAAHGSRIRLRAHAPIATFPCRLIVAWSPVRGPLNIGLSSVSVCVCVSVSRLVRCLGTTSSF